MRIIQIGYERDFFDPNSAASERLSRMSTDEFRTTTIILSSGKEMKREFPNGRVFSFSGMAIVRIWKAFRKTLSEIKQARFSGERVMLSAQDPFFAGLIAFKVSRLANVPYEVQEHGDFFNGYWVKESLMNRVLACVGKFVIRRADLVRVVSERVKDRMIQRFDISSDRIFVRAVDTDLSWHLSQSVRDRSTIPVLIAPCRFVKQKGLDVLLNALADVKRRGLDFRLRLIGSGPLEASLRSQISSLNLSDRVSIESWADQASLWTKADLFVLSSYYEGWARTITEAMATHTPIVATDVGCVGSLLRPQIDGRVVPIGNVHALADAISEQLVEKDRREWMTAQAYERIKEFVSHQHEGMTEQRNVWSEVESRESGVDRVERDGGRLDAVGREPSAVSRSAWKWTGLMLAFAIFIRGLSFLLFWKSLGSHREWGFFTLVQNWFLGNGYSYVNEIGCASAYRSPGYLFILTIIYGLFGFANFFAQALIQNIAGVILVYAVYRLAVELFHDRRIGWIAGAIAALHPYSFYHYSQYYHTVFSSLFLVLFVYALLKLERTKRLSWAVAAGIWTAALAYVTGTILAMMPLMALWILISWRHEWKRAILAISVIAIVSAGLIAPWTIRNWNVFHAFVPLTTDLGYATAKGYNDHVYFYNVLGYPQEAFESTPIPENPYWETYAMLPEVKADMDAHGFVIPSGYFMEGIHPLDRNKRLTCKDQLEMNEVAFSDYWSKLSSKWLKENYWTIGWKIQLQKIQEFWSPVLQPVKRYGAAWSFGNEGLLATAAKIALIVYVSCLEAAALIGLWLLKKRKLLWRIVPFFILFAGYTIMYSMFVGYTKYRIPLDGLLGIVAAIPVITLWDFVLKNRSKKNRV